MTKVSLDVYITGICLFVRNRKEKKPIAVLMPQTLNLGCPHDRTSGGHHAEHGAGKGAGSRYSHIEPHRTVLAVREKHLAPEACVEKKSGWCIVDLAGWSLTLSNGSDLQSTHLGGIYRLHGGGLSRIAKTTFGPELQARVDLASGFLKSPAEGKKFRIDGSKEPMPHYVRWGIDEFEPKLPLVCLRCGETKEIPLEPAGEASIELHIQNVPEHEIGPPPSTPYPKPKKNSKIEHFSALGQLLEDGHDPIDVPVWEDEPGDDTVIISAVVGGNPYTCMPGEGGP